MPLTGGATEGRYGRRGRRGISAIVSLLVIVIVVAGMGLGSFALMGGFSGGPGSTCAPANSPACGVFANLHDVKLVVPLKSVQQRSQVPLTASLPAGESATKFTFLFGDGTEANSTSNIVTHNYTAAGIYLILVQATVNGVVHDNSGGLAMVDVTNSFSADTAGVLPTVQGSIVSNSTSTPNDRVVTAVFAQQGAVTVSASYSASPTNPAYSTATPTIEASNGQLSGQNITPISARATVTYNVPGLYHISFVGKSVQVADPNVTAYQNFTWTVYVAPSGVHPGVAGLQRPTSPHAGTIIDYELAPGGAFSEDPAIDYETVGYEPIINVYQPLILYNGSAAGPDPADFIPALATCVPGSTQCESLYGSTLTDGTNYTFVVNPNSSFYDPATGAHWGVYPSDVVFSLARTLGFSTLPSVSSNPGWIIAQALLDPGNASWNTIHSSFNNTPQGILSSMIVNGSSCPAAAMAPATGHGCVTFHAYGHGHDWPYFLELIADPLGGSIVPCGWFSAVAQGAGIPYWTAGNISGAGDHPCGLPGAAGYGVPVSRMPANGWDRWEQLGSGAFGTYQGHVQFNMVGSGPYYLAAYIAGQSYTLKANPAYNRTPTCVASYCTPAPGSYAPTVEVTWETSATPGEQAYGAGVADFASIPQTDFGLLLQLIGQGKVDAITAPTLTIGFYPFDMTFNLGNAQRYTTQPITVPTDWFSYLGMRELFSRAYPYATVTKTILTTDGVQLGFGYGGAIPQFMGNYYPRDITWPNTDPCSDQTNMTCPSYWWQQMHSPSSPYYDPEVASCSSANPCQVPMFGITGSPTGDEIRAQWAGLIQQITGGAVTVGPQDINFVDVIINSEFSGPGQNALPMYSLGWAPDYPDPTDYVQPLLLPNSTYTYGDAVMQSLWQTQFATGCAHGTTDYNYYANTTFPQSCQGVAYKAMVYALNLAAVATDAGQRILLYDLAEKICYQLSLYVYTSQANQVGTFSAWIDASSLNTNVTVGGGGDQTFFWITGNNVQGVGST